ncbi:MAG TPA: tetratricopeptide repeat protein [Clostridia bacterium]|nr:tetratricopeptide repeat protein [Clostridia bacterium]
MNEPIGSSEPTGTLTFLFTDIEGSTRLEIELGTAAYAELRERHRALLRAAFAAHDGKEQATEGDSFFVVFPSARYGVLAAVEGQRALAATDWPGGAEVRVRMGLHAGEASLAGGDLVGYDINRAARIASAAHGGQIVVSDAVRALAAGLAADGVELRDLGEHRLKDLVEPEQLAQVVAAGLAESFPPLHSIDRPTNHLPVQLTSFIGRQQELEGCLRLLAGTRLLTLTGPGGIGKTRLSLEIASAAVSEFPDGLWFVPLEPVRERALVLPTIAHTLGVTERANRPAIDGIAEVVGDGRVLFVLDNFEQVIDAAPVVPELLARVPGLKVVVSSRTALRVSGEQEFAVPGLPSPPDPSRLPELEQLNLPPELREIKAATLDGFEAAQLFLARARAIRPEFQLTDANAPAVARIAARLHGMPLAIELAAARIKLLSPDQIASRLEDHLALLTSGSRDLPERQQTLRGAIAWSYELLEPGIRRLFDRLAVFVGGFDLDAAERVCGPASELGVDVLDGVATLVDQSLVRSEEVDGVQRFGMLDAIRSFAAEMLAASGECEAIEERAARVFLELAESAAPNLSGSDQRAWLDRLERDHDTMRRTIVWAANRPDQELAVRVGFALWRFWQQRGYLNEARDRLADLAGRKWDLAPALRARLAEARGGVAYWQADHVEARECYQLALDAWREIGDEREIANALYNRAYADAVEIMQYARGDLNPGRAMLDEALALYRNLGDRVGEGNILWGMGMFSFFAGEFASAESAYERSLELHRAGGNRTMEAWSHHMLALAQLGQDKIAEAKASAAAALRHFREAGDVAGITLVLDDLAGLAVADGDLPRAGRMWGAARHLQQITGADLASFNETGFGTHAFPTPTTALSPEDLERYGAEGAAMSLDDAVAYAFDTFGDAPTEGAPGRDEPIGR